MLFSKLQKDTNRTDIIKIKFFISSFLSKSRINDMQYIEKYKLFLHTFNKKIEETIKVNKGSSYFNEEMNRRVCNETDSIYYVRAIHKLGEIEKLFKVAQEIYDSEYVKLGVSTLEILRYWIG